MTLNCKGALIDLQIPKIMGILNITPDSFYDGGKYKDHKSILVQVEKMISEGATFIDIGANSTRPGAIAVSETEELNRLIPIVELLLKNFPELLLSIDTFRSKVAEESLHTGAAMINDISAGKRDDHMLPIIAKFKVPFVMMHMRGTPKTMQQQTQYTHLLKEVLQYFSERVAKATSMGINDLIIDPGFGFAKTLEQNYELLRQLEGFKTLGHPILAGLSRKSMIYKALGSDAQNALNGTTALNMYALQKGATILRVHDVKEARECVQLIQQLAS